MKLSAQLYSIVGALALIGAVVAGSGTWYLRSLNRELTIATGKTAVKLDLVNAARARAWEMIASNRGMFISGFRQDQAGIDARARSWNAAFKRTVEQINEMRPLIATEEGGQDLAKFESALAKYEKVSAELLRLCRENKLQQVETDVNPKVQEFENVTEETLDHLKNVQRKLLKDSQAHAASIGSQSLLVSIVLNCLMLAIVIVAVLLVRAIHRTLVTVVSELSSGAHEVAGAAFQVSSSSQSLAQGSSEQAASLEETSASTAEINSMARRNSENTRVAADLMAQSQEKFVQTNQSLDESVVAMDEINTQSGKISKIIKVIDEIAFQTNILALNAAVEAARAGESGMGFAVVADEVRNLAQRSAQAAKDTGALIEESIAKSNVGKHKVDQVATAIRAVTEKAATVKITLDEVNLGSQDQANGIQQIGKAIIQMEKVTQSIAANSEESAAAAEQLNAQSEALKKIARRLAAMVV